MTAPADRTDASPAAAASSSADNFEAARVSFVAGVQAFEGGDPARAEACFLEALRLVPGRPSTLINLAAVRQRLGRPAEALPALDEALAAAPDDAAAWFQHGQLLQVLQRPHDALRSYERVLALEPAQAAAWTQRGSLLKDMGRHAEAAQCFRQALASGGDAELNRYFLASVERAPAAGGVPLEAPGSAPRHYVEQLFDSYADGFDEHLVGKLGYRTPWLIADMVLGKPDGAPRRWGAALDLGCGTGLMGPLLAPHCEALDGVDLSSQMLAKAAALGRYRYLVHADLAEHLQGTGERYELVVAADVFVYVGDLDTVFAGVARVLDGDSTFAFSVEEAAAGVPRYELRASSRYAHAETYLRELAAAHGFEPADLRRTAIRHEQRQPIGGLLVVLRRR
jgi:predicted TPR repeat methyltransferase